MQVIIPELETAGERWVRLRDSYLHELEACDNLARRREIKDKLREAFEEWLESL